MGVEGVISLPCAVPRAAIYIRYIYGNIAPRAPMSIRGYVVEKAGLDTLINRKRSTHLDSYIQISPRLEPNFQNGTLLFLPRILNSFSLKINNKI